MFYAIPTARVIFTAKTSLDIFSLRREQVWIFSVSGDRIYEMRCLFVVVGLNTFLIVLPHWDSIGPHSRRCVCGEVGRWVGRSNAGNAAAPTTEMGGQGRVCQPLQGACDEDYGGVS